jgi:hypothetical protein
MLRRGGGEKKKVSEDARLAEKYVRPPVQCCCRPRISELDASSGQFCMLGTSIAVSVSCLRFQCDDTNGSVLVTSSVNVTPIDMF